MSLLSRPDTALIYTYQSSVNVLHPTDTSFPAYSGLAIAGLADFTLRLVPFSGTGITGIDSQVIDDLNRGAFEQAAETLSLYSHHIRAGPGIAPFIPSDAFRVIRGSKGLRLEQIALNTFQDEMLYDNLLSRAAELRLHPNDPSLDSMGMPEIVARVSRVVSALHGSVISSYESTKIGGDFAWHMRGYAIDSGGNSETFDIDRYAAFLERLKGANLIFNHDGTVDSLGRGSEGEIVRETRKPVDREEFEAILRGLHS